MCPLYVGLVKCTRPHYKYMMTSSQLGYNGFYCGTNSLYTVLHGMVLTYVSLNTHTVLRRQSDAVTKLNYTAHKLVSHTLALHTSEQCSHTYTHPLAPLCCMSIHCIHHRTLVIQARKPLHCGKGKLTLFSLVSGFNHFGRKWAASINRNSPSLSSILMRSKGSQFTDTSSTAEYSMGLIFCWLNFHVHPIKTISNTNPWKLWVKCYITVLNNDGGIHSQCPFVLL